MSDCVRSLKSALALPFSPSAYQSFSRHIHFQQTSTPAAWKDSIPGLVFSQSPAMVTAIPCDQPHVSQDSGIEGSSHSQVVFTDFSHSSESEVQVNCCEDTQYTDSLCANCCQPFPKRKGGHQGRHRYALSSIGVTDSELLERGSFVCPSCRNFLKRKSTKRLLSGLPAATNMPKNRSSQLLSKNILNVPDTVSDGETNMLLTPVRDHSYAKTFKIKRTPSSCARSPCSDVRSPFRKKIRRQVSSPCIKYSTALRKNKHSRRVAFKQPAIRLIEQSKYKRALEVMFQSPNRFVHKAFTDFLQTAIRKEVHRFARSSNTCSVTQKFNYQTLANFKWMPAINELKKSMPLALCAVESLFPDVQHVSKITTIGRSRLLLVRLCSFFSDYFLAANFCLNV